MYIYYRQKEKEDLLKVDAVNEILATTAKAALKLSGVEFSREHWLEVLSGATCFKDVLIDAYMSQKYGENAPEMDLYCFNCPTDVQIKGELVTTELGAINFRPGIVKFLSDGTPQICAKKIKQLYPHWYTVQVDDLSDEAIKASKATAKEFGNNENFLYAHEDFCNAMTFIERPGFRYGFTTKGKVKAIITFNESDYYEDMAKKKLHIH